MKIILAFILICTLTANVYSQLNDLSIKDQWSSLEIENLSVVNSEGEEFSPHIWSNYLVYIGLQERAGLSTKGPEYFDIKASILNDSLDLKNFIFNPKLNSRYHEGPISWDQKNNTLYFTRASTDNGQLIVDSNGRQLLEIYKAEYAQGKWINIGKMNFCTEEENYCHPAVFNEGKSMIFASSMNGGSGKMDLYRTEKVSELTWTTPTNLGKQVNNPGNDWFPFVYGDYLFHATDVKDGQGMDIYLSKLGKDGKPTPIFRLPAPINSQYDDFGLVISIENNIAYFSSNRPGGKGKDDIYKIILDKTLVPSEAKEIQNQDARSAMPGNKPNSKPRSFSSKQGLTFSITDAISKKGINEAEVKIYVLPPTMAESFAQQLDSGSDLILLESMATNIASIIEYKSDTQGLLSLNNSQTDHLFIVVKKLGYKPASNYINPSDPVSELGFALELK